MKINDYRATNNYLILTDDNGNVYNFNSTFFIKEEALDSRSSITDRLYANGGRDTGDGGAPARKITVEGQLQAVDKTDFETQLRALNIARKKGGLLSIHNDVVSRSIEVRHGKQTPEWKYYNTDPGGGFVKQITIAFECEFPYWEDTAFITDSNTLAGDGTFATDCTGSDDVVLPIITITATDDCPSIKITNLDDGGMYFEYNNPQFVAGSVLVVDSAMGTITLNGNDARSYIMPGSAFLRLQMMNNNFNYLGAACVIIVSYKRCYA
jgi:hypothetical protein